MSAILSSLGISLATLCVGTVSPTITCNTTYTKTAQHVQDAMDAAADGDTVYIEPGFKYSQAFAFRGDHSGGAVTVSTGLPEYLPCALCRITPSHMPAVMPLLSSNIVGCPALSGVRDAGGNPPKGWNFVGLAFSVDYENTVFDLITNGGGGSSYQCGGDAVSRYFIANASDAPASITYDRVFAMLRFPDLSYSSTNGFDIEGSNIVLKNSFLWPFYSYNLNENHGFAQRTGPGPLTATNNFITAGGAPYFTGGAEGDYPDSQAGSWTVRYNFFHKPWKWYPATWDPSDFSITPLGSPCANPGVGSCYTTANPYPTYYGINLARHGGAYKIACLKNLGEYKLIDGATHQYNVHEQQPVDGGGNCLSQYFAQTLTVRGFHNPNPLWWGSLANSPGQSKWMDDTVPGTFVNGVNNGSLRSSGTAMTWQSPCGDGGPPIPYCGTNAGYPLNWWIAPKNSICIDPSAKSLDTAYDPSLHVFVCRKVNSPLGSVDVTGAMASNATLASAFSPDITVPATTLTAGINASTLTIPVASTAGWAPYMVALIGTEFVQICSVGASDLTACPAGTPSGRGYCLVSLATNCAGGAAVHPNGAAVTRVLTWFYNQNNSGKWRNVNISNNVFRNVASTFNVLAKDRIGATADAGADSSKIVGLSITNNLFYDTVANHKKFGIVYRIFGQEQVSEYQPTVSGTDINTDHNTIYWPTDQPAAIGISLTADGTPDALAPKIGNFQIRSNLWPDASFFAIGLLVGTSQNSYSMVNTWTSGNSSITYNQLRYASTSGCAPSSCAGALNGAYDTNVSFLPGTYKVTSTSAVAKAGHDGTDMGVQYGLQPLIRNLQVRTSDKTALLSFGLTSPIADAGNTQPCMVEVTNSEEIQSMIGLAGQNWTLPYTPINALNPRYFKAVGSTVQTNPLILSATVATDGTVLFPIGQQATVTGDDGVSHDLRLSASTQYWGRAMCYGDTQWFTFTTAASSTGVTSITKQFTPPSAATSVVVEYGATSALGSSVTASVSGGTATATIPVTAGNFLYFRYLYKNGGTTIYTSQPGLELP